MYHKYLSYVYEKDLVSISLDIPLNYCYRIRIEDGVVVFFPSKFEKENAGRKSRPAAVHIG